MGWVLLIGVSALFAAAAAQVWLPSVAMHPVSNRPLEEAAPGYVSSGACRACHPRNYATWRASWHRTMTQRVAPGNVLGSFDGIEQRLLGRTYRLHRRGRQFWGDFSSGDGSRVKQVQLVMSTGSHHMQVYWYPVGQGRLLGQFPLAYVKEAQRWIPRNAAFLMPPGDDPVDETGRWNSTCIKCHTTNGRPRVVSLVPSADGSHVDTRATEFGIACEACHGPGAEHTSANRSPLRRYRLHVGGGPDSTIVNPQQLTQELGSQVCGQCHSVMVAKDQRTALRIHHEGALYRPGDALSATRVMVSPRAVAEPTQWDELLARNPDYLRSRFWSDGRVRVSGREYNGLTESPCYTHGDESRGILSCMSCHRLHQDTGDPRLRKDWADDLLDVGMRTNRACVQCHDRFLSEESLALHTRHEPGSSGSLCYNCHMPHTTYGLLKAIRSHTITSPSVAETLDTGRPNACNHCHLDKTLAWTSAQLERWYGTQGTPLGEVHRSVPASVAAVLGGDAGERALAAWAMGWEPAMAVSGAGWRERFLGLLLNDPYDAVRYIAYQSLRRQPGYEDLVYDFLAPAEEREHTANKVLQGWTASNEDSLEQQEIYARLLARRDNRPLTLAE